MGNSLGAEATLPAQVKEPLQSSWLRGKSVSPRAPVPSEPKTSPSVKRSPGVFGWPPESVAQSLRLLATRYWQGTLARATADGSADSEAWSATLDSESTTNTVRSLPPVGDRLWLRALISLRRQLGAQLALGPDSPGGRFAGTAAVETDLDDEPDASTLGALLRWSGESLGSDSQLPLLLLGVLSALDQLKAIYALRGTVHPPERGTESDDWSAAVSGACWFLCRLLLPSLRSRWAEGPASTLPDQVALQHFQYIILVFSAEYLLLSADRDHETFLLSGRLLLQLLDWLGAVGNTALIRWLHPLTDRCVHLLLHHLIRDTMECIHRQGLLETPTNVDVSAGDASLSSVIYQDLKCDFLGLEQARSMNKPGVSVAHDGNPHRLREPAAETVMPSWLRFWPFSASSPRPEHDGPDAAVSSRLGIQPHMSSLGESMPASRAPKIAPAGSVAVADAFQGSSASSKEQGPCLPTDHLSQRTLLWMAILLALLSFPDEDTGEIELPRWHDRGVHHPFRKALAAALAQTTPESPRNVAAHGDRSSPAAHESTLDVLYRREHRQARPIVLPQLHDVVVWWLSYTEGSYLLYFMTHDSARHWRRYLTARTDPETLLLPLLRMLYSDEANTTAEVLLATLLMLTDDDGWCLALANRVLEHPIHWYREAQLIPGRFTLADFVICILVRFIRRKRKDGPLVSLAIATLSGLAPAAAAAPRPSPPDARVGIPRLFLLFELYWRQWKRYHEQWDDASRIRVLCLLGSVLELLFAVWVAADFEPRQCGVLGDDLINAAPHIQQAVRLTGRTYTPMERFFATLIHMVVATDHDWSGPNQEHNAVERPVESLETPLVADSSMSPSQRSPYASSAPVDGQAPATPESIRDAICSWARHWRRQQSRTMRRLVYRFEEQPGAARARLGPSVWALVARRTGWPVSGAFARSISDTDSLSC